MIDYLYGVFFKGDQIGPYPFGCDLKLFEYLETKKKPMSYIQKTDWWLTEMGGWEK